MPHLPAAPGRALALRSVPEQLALAVTLCFSALLGCSDGGAAPDGSGGVGAGSGSGGTMGAGGGSATGGVPGGGGSVGGGGTPGAGGMVGVGGTSAAGGATAAGGAPSTGGNTGTGGVPDTANTWTIVSPGGTVRATIELADKGGTSGFPSGERLYYTVQAGGPSSYVTVLEDSPLGLTRSDAGFAEGLALVAADTTTSIEESYTMLVGKQSSIDAHAHERVLHFESSDAQGLDLVLRAYDDGFAFRYRFPEMSEAEYTVTGEDTGFKLPEGSRGWLLPYDAAADYAPAYENYWQHDVAAGTESPTAPGWCFPALFRTPSDTWVLLADTDVNGSYFAAHLEPAAQDNVYRIAMPETNEANGVGDVEPTATLPWEMPWRMVITGSLASVVESTLPTDLATPSVLSDTSWIRPGRASWSWWAADNNPTNYAANTPYVDLSEAMGWEYSLIDHGWHEMGGGGTWQDLVSYAAARNVGLLIWYNSGGSHNSVGLTPRDRMTDPTTRRSEMQAISEAGIKGIKVDFFHGDKPWLMQYYLDILADAADYELLVNFHGSTIPRGWQRTYPNLMTAEAVRGSEWYKYDANYAGDQPRRNTILPFTRNVLSSMDFTPVTFTNHAYPHLTTYGHELALSVVFESGLQHFPDRVQGYNDLPTAPRTFLQQVPSTWDETRLVDGAPGEWVVLARRKGDVWYVGGISGQDSAMDVTLNVGFLGAGTYSATVISDGNSDTTFNDSSTTLAATDALPVALRARGGFVVRFDPQ